MHVSKIAFVGTRGHQDAVLRELPSMPQIRVVGLCEGDGGPIDPIAQWCRAHGHQPRVYIEYVEMLRDARPDAVIICGALERHAEMVIEAIHHGIHVLVEKPLTMTMQELDAVREAHRQAPAVHLASMQTARHLSGFYTAKQLVASGSVGDVRLIDARKSYKFGTRGDHYASRDTYCGTIPWVGAHAIDWVLWIGGHGIESVYASHSARFNQGAGTMERSAVCHFTLCGERYASVSIDMFRPSTAPTHGDDWVRVVGTTGVLEARPSQVVLINEDGVGPRAIQLETPPAMFEDFVAHAEGRWVALNAAEHTFATTAACLMARESADVNRVLHAKSFTDVRIKTVVPDRDSIDKGTPTDVLTSAALLA